MDVGVGDDGGWCVFVVVVKVKVRLTNALMRSTPLSTRAFIPIFRPQSVCVIELNSRQQPFKVT